VHIRHNKQKYRAQISIEKLNSAKCYLVWCLGFFFWFIFIVFQIMIELWKYRANGLIENACILK
jgi:hypothetical protein